MREFDSKLLKTLYAPPLDSHKAQNGKLLLIGGSSLFHAASLWSLTIASKILDMVFYASVPENNEIVHEAKKEFRNGIVIRREHIKDYVREADCILIGPGMMRTEVNIYDERLFALDEISSMSDEGEQTYYLAHYLLKKYPDKKYVLDAGVLQMMDPEWLRGLSKTPILTPHKREFLSLFGVALDEEDKKNVDLIQREAKKNNSVIVVKGVIDVIASKDDSVLVLGGNAGMTKGGTGDVLAGLIASLYCKNDAFISAAAGSYVNKKAGESLYRRVGYYYNASDLVEEIPHVMKKLL